MNQRASCRYLTHKHAAFNGCTLAETVLIVIGYLMISIMLSLLCLLFLSNFVISFLILFVISLGLIKYTASVIGSLKLDKPQGYLISVLRLSLHKKLGFSIPQICRVGVWSTKRKYHVN